MILFLDLDGVLHPDEAYLVHGRPVLRAEGELFMWAPLLIDVLADCPSGMNQSLEGFDKLRLTWWDRATRYQPWPFVASN